MGCFYKYLHLKFYTPIYNKVLCGFIGGDYSIKVIGVGFALLVQLHRAMRRPQDVERATKSNLHAFSLYMPALTAHELSLYGDWQGF